MYSVPWKEILTLGIVPLVKWIVQRTSGDECECPEKAAQDAKEEEDKLIKVRLKKKILDARKNQKWKDIDPSKYEV